MLTIFTKAACFAALASGFAANFAHASSPRTDGSNLGGGQVVAYEPCPEPDHHFRPVRLPPIGGFALVDHRPDQHKDPGFIVIIINIG
jgi:hypothetical protein